MTGAGRPWLRGKYPDAGLGKNWRMAVGNTYISGTSLVVTPDAYHCAIGVKTIRHTYEVYKWL